MDWPLTQEVLITSTLLFLRFMKNIGEKINCLICVAFFSRLVPPLSKNGWLVFKTMEIKIGHKSIFIIVTKSILKELNWEMLVNNFCDRFPKKRSSYKILYYEKNQV